MRSSAFQINQQYPVILSTHHFWIGLINSTQIVYNRVPKCRGTTFLEVIILLAKRNGFRYEHSQIYSQWDQNERKQRRLVKSITQRKEQFLYDRHVYMIDFARFVSKGFRYRFYV